MNFDKTTPPVAMLKLLTAKDVACFLQVSLRRFEQMVASGDAPEHLKIGRLRRWRPADIEEWTMSRRTSG